MTVFDPAENPYAPPAFRGEPVVESESTAGRRAVGKGTLVVGTAYMLVVAGGALGTLIDTESVIVTGCLLTAVGALLGILARGAALLPVRLLGASGPVLSLGCFLTIFTLEWSPQEARQPMILVAAFYIAFAPLMVIWSWRRHRSRLTPDPMGRA